MRGLRALGLTMLSIVLLAACGSPSATPSPTPTATPQPTATPYPLGPSVVVYDSLLVSLVVPERAEVGEEVLFQLAFANIGGEAIAFYHQADVAEFILVKDGDQVMSSHDQLRFPQPINYENRLAPNMTRRYETGFTAATFVGVLIDGDNEPLPPGTYEIYGIAHISNAQDGTYEEYETPPATIEIVAP